MGALTAHFKQQVTDQKALSKWNINAEGRNQGLVHLLDYAFARPSKLAVSPETDVKSQCGINEMQYHMLSLLDEPSAAPVAREVLTSPARAYKLTEPQLEKLVTKGYFEAFETPEFKLAKQRAETLDAELKQLLLLKRQEILSRHVTGKAIGTELDLYKSTDITYKDKDALCSAAVLELKQKTSYVLARDISKRGRLQRIAESGGVDIARGKEIETGTKVVTDLIVSTAATNVTSSAPTRALTMWMPTGAQTASGRTKWHEVVVPASGLKTTSSGEFKARGLTVKVWGVLDNVPADLNAHAKQLGISTVMGGS